jgi:hypothetical protein
MLTLTIRDEENLFEDSKELTSKSTMPSGISSIEWPPFPDVKIFI